MSVLVAELETARTAEAAARAGETPHVAHAADSKRASLAAIAAALDFPDWFGHNLDALFDCLIDLSWLPVGAHLLAWAGAERLRAADPVACEGIQQVLVDAQDWHAQRGSARLRVVLLD